MLTAASGQDRRQNSNASTGSNWVLGLSWAEREQIQLQLIRYTTKAEWRMLQFP